MKKIITTIAAITFAFSLAGCKEDKPATVAPQLSQEDVQKMNENIAKSTPLQGPLVIPEKGKYKY